MAKYRILLVDDDEDVRAVLAAALRTIYEVVEAGDGLEALDRLEILEPDFAIIDALMPVMDGFQLCESIRRHEKFSSIPVLFLSAYSSEENIKKGYASGANLFVPKPVDPMRVVKNVTFTIKHEKPLLRAKRYTPEEAMEVEIPPSEPPEPEEPETPTRPARIATPPSPRPSRAAPDEDDRFDDDDEDEMEDSGGPEDSEELDYETTDRQVEKPAAPPGARPRLLIVENEEDMRTLLNLSLRQSYEITMAGDGVDAIEKIVKYQPDIVLLDIMMPKMNGYQLLQTVRRNRVYNSLPIIIVSGKSSKRDIDYAKRLGATDYVGKPFEPADLIDKIEAVAAQPGFQVKPKQLTMKEVEIEEEKRARRKAAGKTLEHGRES